jgi:hypothetical protein
MKERMNKLHTHFKSENLKRRDHLADLALDGWIILKKVLTKYGRSA